MRVLFGAESLLKGGGNCNPHGFQALEELWSFTEAFDEGTRHGGEQVTFGNTPTIRVLRDGEHVLVGVEGSQAQVDEDLVRGLGHFQGAFEAGGALRGEPCSDFFAGFRRNALNRHIGNPHGVGVVELTRRQRALGVEDCANLEAGDRAHRKGSACGRHLGGGGNGVMVDGADDPQSGTAGVQCRGGRRVGAEGVAGVNVVVRLGNPFGE